MGSGQRGCRAQCCRSRRAPRARWSSPRARRTAAAYPCARTVEIRARERAAAYYLLEEYPRKSPGSRCRQRAGVLSIHDTLQGHEARIQAPEAPSDAPGGLPSDLVNPVSVPVRGGVAAEVDQRVLKGHLPGHLVVPVRAFRRGQPSRGNRLRALGPARGALTSRC